jgi:hypothetical protein
MLSHASTNVLSSFGDAVLETGRNALEKDEEMRSGERYFMCPPSGDSSRIKVDPPDTTAQGSAGAGESPLGSAGLRLSRTPVSPSRVGSQRGSTGSSVPVLGSVPSATPPSEPQTNPGDGGQRRR